MKKRLLIGFLTTTFLFTMLFGGTAYAINGDAGTDATLLEEFTLDAQREVILEDDSLTAEEKAISLERIKITEYIERNGDAISINNAEMISRISEIAPRATTNSVGFVVRPVWVSTQINNWFCGPATGVQTLNYFDRNMRETQHTLAAAFGTTTAGTDGLRMLREINNRKSGLPYMVAHPTTPSSTEFFIFGGLSTFNMPPILRIRTIAGIGWDYVTNGHFLNASGYCGFHRSVELTDPFIKRLHPWHSGKYWMPLQLVHDATLRHPQRHMYW